MTTECSCRLCPSPGMYTVTSMPLVSRTLATFRSAEFGFLGVVVYTRRQTPRFCGQESSAGELLLLATTVRPFRINWLIVGIPYPSGDGNSIPIERIRTYNNCSLPCQRLSSRPFARSGTGDRDP